jgi:hypothetical protein
VSCFIFKREGKLEAKEDSPSKYMGDSEINGKWRETEGKMRKQKNGSGSGEGCRC